MVLDIFRNATHLDAYYVTLYLPVCSEPISPRPVPNARKQEEP